MSKTQHRFLWARLRKQSRDQRERNNLSFRELEPLARALLTVLLTLARARVATQQSKLLQLRPQLGIKLEQCAGNAQPRGAGLTVGSTAVRQNNDVELVRQLS